MTDRCEALWACQDYFSDKIKEQHRLRPFVPGEVYIPVAQQCMNHEDMLQIVDVALDLRLAGGKYVKEFEETLAPYFGRKTSALLVNSGSSANLIAVSALGLKPGDEVITVAAGFPTTVNPIIQCGAVPVFVDVDFETLNTTLERVKAAQSDKTKAVVLAHALGNPFRADEIAQWCDENNLALVEDCCDALGATIGGAFVGSFGDLATCSFYPAHHISMGEGGAVMASGKLRRTAESIRDWGRDCWCEPGKDNTCGKRFSGQAGQLPCGYDHKYTYTRIGYNLKATELQAAVGVSQLAKVGAFIEARRKNYRKLYYGVDKTYLQPVEATFGTDPSWFGFPMHVKNGIDRAKLINYLEDHKIGTRLVFGGNLTKQPAYKDVKFRIQRNLHNTDLIMNHTFWIGLHPAIDDARMEYMLQTLDAGVKEQL